MQAWNFCMIFYFLIASFWKDFFMLHVHVFFVLSCFVTVCSYNIRFPKSLDNTASKLVTVHTSYYFYIIVSD